MISVLISVPEQGWQKWFETLKSCPRLHDVEVAAGLLPDWLAASAAARDCGLRLFQLHHLLPAAETDFLARTDAAGLDKLLAHLNHDLEIAAVAGVRSISLDLDLRQAPLPEDDPEMFAGRVNLLRRIIPLASKYGQTLCLHVRCPAEPPQSRERTYAGKLILETMNPSCRLVLDLFPAEFPPGFDVKGFLRANGAHVSAIRFHYEVNLGDVMDQAQLQAWAHTLRQFNFHGSVAFCPHVGPDEDLRSICAAADAGAAFYGESL